MSLHPTMKRRLHERLHPLIGEEEADALLDEISSPDPVTREWLTERFHELDDRFYTRDLMDQKLQTLRHQIAEDVHIAWRAQSHWVFAAVAFFAGLLTFFDKIWG